MSAISTESTTHTVALSAAATSITSGSTARRLASRPHPSSPPPSRVPLPLSALWEVLVQLQPTTLASSNGPNGKSNIMTRAIVAGVAGFLAPVLIDKGLL